MYQQIIDKLKQMVDKALKIPCFVQKQKMVQSLFLCFFIHIVYKNNLIDNINR